MLNITKVPNPKTKHNGNLGVISAVRAVKNALLLGFDLVFIRAKHYFEDNKKCVNNSVVDGKETQKGIK